MIPRAYLVSLLSSYAMRSPFLLLGTESPSLIKTIAMTYTMLCVWAKISLEVVMDPSNTLFIFWRTIRVGIGVTA